MATATGRAEIIFCTPTLEAREATLEKVVERAKKLTVGNTTGEENLFMGAVIDRSALERIKGYLDFAAAATDAEILVGGGTAGPRLDAMDDSQPEASSDSGRPAAIIGVLDWEMARLGDPVQDLAWWLASDRCFSEGLELARLPGFPGKDETIARWEQSTGREAASFDYYTILALTRFSMNMARVGQYMKKIEIIDEENEFDYENLASITLRRALSEL